MKGRLFFPIAIVVYRCRLDAKEKPGYLSEEYTGFRPRILVGSDAERGGPTNTPWSNFFLFRPVVKIGRSSTSRRTWLV